MEMYLLFGSIREHLKEGLTLISGVRSNFDDVFNDLKLVLVDMHRS